MGCLYAHLGIDYGRALRNRLRAVLIDMNWVPLDNLVRLTSRSQPVINTKSF